MGDSGISAAARLKSACKTTTELCKCAVCSVQFHFDLFKDLVWSLSFLLPLEVLAILFGEGLKRVPPIHNTASTASDTAKEVNSFAVDTSVHRRAWLSCCGRSCLRSQETTPRFFFEPNSFESESHFSGEVRFVRSCLCGNSACHVEWVYIQCSRRGRLWY